MEHVAVVVIGGGQAGLALGYYLQQQGADFIILDGAPTVGHVWRTRYDSLRLFTPAWFSQLPGLPLPLAPDTYPTKDDIADYLVRYAAAFELPVRLNTRVTSVQSTPNGYLVQTEEQVYAAQHVVVATGPFQRAWTPPFAADLAADVFQLHSSGYRNPAQLPAGNVLVVGGGNSGMQIAVELAQSRKVFLAMGTRQPALPQQLLGKDLFWWLRRLGVLEVTIRSRLGQRLSRTDPVIGTSLRRIVQDLPLERVTRATGADGRAVTLADGRCLPVQAVIWATGFRPDYGWIDVPVFDQAGRPVHERGITAARGLYFLGLPWLVRRDSALIGGVSRDAEFLASRIATAVAQDAQERTSDIRPGDGSHLMPSGSANV